jgi:hypothetical protein
MVSLDTPASLPFPPDDNPVHHSQHQIAPTVPKCGARGRRHTYLFVPEPDITAAELAAAMEILLFGFAGMLHAAPPELVDRLWNAMDEHGRRHWKCQELPQIAVPTGKMKSKPNGHGGLHLPPGARS